MVNPMTTTPVQNGRIHLAMRGPVAGVSSDDQVTVNDVDITNAVTAIEIPFTKVGDLLQLNVSLLAHAGVVIDKAAHIGLTTATERALEAMRWVPPLPDLTVSSAKGAIMLAHAYNEHGSRFSDCNTCLLELQETEQS